MDIGNTGRVKILMSAYSFDPSIGGIETASRLLAVEFVRLGHEVTVVTMTRHLSTQSYPFEVVRRPPPHRLIALLRWADVYFQVHISLVLGWPLLLVRRPWVVTQHSWLPTEGGIEPLKSHIKRFLMRFASAGVISHALARDVPSASHVIAPPYDATIFRQMPEVMRQRELIFVGRLLHYKGVHLLLEALAILRSRGHDYRLTVVGFGVEENALRRRAHELQLADQVAFAGLRKGTQLAAILNAHQIIVVPSLFQEPFGIVALEGCACGCVVVGSEVGGVPEAIGPCGLTFPNGDAQTLADRVEMLLSTPATLDKLRSSSGAHLAAHTPAAVATAYMQLFQSEIVKG
jgi:glycosyltransferase involved in cell wall biosynthesis